MKRVRNLILVYLAMSLIGSTWQLWMSIGVPIGSKYYLLLQYLALPVLLLAVRAAKMRLPAPHTTGGLQTNILLYSLVLAAATAHGMISNDIQFALSDTWVAVTFICFVLLGRYNEVWEALEKPMTALFWICFCAVIVGMSRPMIVSTGSGGYMEGSESLINRERGTVSSVGSRICGTLEFWPVLLALGYSRIKKDIWKIVGIGVVVGYVATAIAFQYRSKFTAVGMYAISLVVVIPMLQRKLRFGSGLLVLLGLGVVLAVASGMRSYESLSNRFAQESAWVGRFREIGLMFSDLAPLQYAIGKGMGGSYYAPGGGIGGAIKSAYTGPGWIRLELHSGFLLPILKGGILLLIPFYMFFFRAFLPKPRGWYQDRFNIVAMSVIPVYLIYLFMVPQPGLEDFLFAVMPGMCCARFGCLPKPQYAPYGYPADRLPWNPGIPNP